MPDDIVLRPQGRVSEPSPDAAPPGSMLVAENVTIREEGIVRHLGNSTVISTGTGNTIWNISPQFDNGATPGQLCYSGDANGTSTGVAMSGAIGTEIQYTDVDGTATTVQYFDHGDGESMPPMYIARDNLYLSDQRGMYKLTDTDASSLVRVWDNPVTLELSSIPAGTLLPDGSHVGYRAVAVFEDSNGVVTRSAPSAMVVSNNTSGGTIDVTVIARVNVELTGLRGVEFYRTATYANTISLPNELGLLFEVPVGSMANGFPEIWRSATKTDAVPDDQRDAALYTNSSQGGAAATNIAPPEHLYHASFRGHEFWGDVAEKEFFAPLERVDASNLTHSITGNVSYSSGSPTVTADTLNGAEVGMLISYVNADFLSGTYITAISGAGPFTITMSEDADSSGTSTISVWDTIYVLWGDGSESRVMFGSEESLWRVDKTIATQHLDIFAFGGSDFGEDSQYANHWTVASQHRAARQGPAQMWVSNPSEYSNADWADLDTGTGAPTTGGTEAEQALHRARIYWSKFQEPEHTTLANFQDVGNASGIGGGQIVGLGALREALIIVKTDGVFRLTGDRGNWRIDPLDTSVRMIGGRSVQVMDNQVYALSERGVVRITAQGVTDLTDGIVGDWFGEAGIGTHRAGDIREYMLENDGYHPPLLQGAVDTTNREYVLMAEGSRGGSNGGDAELLVFNAKTGSFTTWELFTATLGIASIGYARGDYSGTAEQYPGIVFGRAVGEGNGELRLIQNQRGVSGTDFPVELRFRARTEADPTHVKLWTDAVWQMAPGGDTRADVACIFQASEDGTDETVAVSNDGGTRQIRCWIPRGAARSDELVAGISGDNVSVRGFRLTFRSSGRRAPVSND